MQKTPAMECRRSHLSCPDLRSKALDHGGRAFDRETHTRRPTYLAGACRVQHEMEKRLPITRVELRVENESLRAELTKWKSCAEAFDAGSGNCATAAPTRSGKRRSAAARSSRLCNRPRIV